MTDSVSHVAQQLRRIIEALQQLINMNLVGYVSYSAVT